MAELRARRRREALERRARREAARAQARRGRASPSAGLAVDDVYVFGSGMDYRGYWRGSRGIYAARGDRRMTDASRLIVGSGFERLGFEVLTRSPTKTPYGEPSSAVLTIADRRRARRVHRPARRRPRVRAARDQLPRERLGARAARRAPCIGVNTVGAIDAAFAPGELAVPDQLIDYTHGRARDVRRCRRARTAHRVHGAVLAGAAWPARERRGRLRARRSRRYLRRDARAAARDGGRDRAHERATAVRWSG